MSSDFYLHYSSDEDEDFKQALQNSLHTQSKGDDDLKKAIQLSMEEHKLTNPTTTTTTSTSTSTTTSETSQQRVTDTEKKKPSNYFTTKYGQEDTKGGNDKSLKQAIQNSLQDDLTQSSAPKPPQTEKKAKIEWGWYLNRLPGFSREANMPSLSLNDIVVPKGLASALITTYELDMQWLLSQLPVLTKIPVTMVHGEKDPDALPRPPPNIVYHKPNLPLQWGVHHGKMFVLYYPEFVRVAISTANLIMIDYHRKSQGIWMQDFPRKAAKTPISSDFEATLVDYVARLGLSTDKIKHYDYSTANVVLVTSVPGYHKGPQVDKYGHMKVRSILQRERMNGEFSNAPVACQFSSTGSLSKDWVVDEMMTSLTANGGFYGAVNKEEPNEEAEENEGKEKGKKRSRSSRDTLSTPMKLIWPTVEFVRNSLDGWASGGSLCFPAKNCKGFFQELSLFHAYTSFNGREHVPPHIKTYSRYSDDGTLAWNYLTSSNLSKAAMGELQKNGTQLMIRHYEIGILFVPSLYNNNNTTPPPRFISLQHYLNSSSIASAQTIGFPLPYTLPPKVYNDNDKPWLWDIPHNNADVCGKRWLC